MLEHSKNYDAAISKGLKPVCSKAKRRIHNLMKRVSIAQINATKGMSLVAARCAESAYYNTSRVSYYFAEHDMTDDEVLALTAEAVEHLLLPEWHHSAGAIEVGFYNPTFLLLAEKLWPANNKKMKKVHRAVRIYDYSKSWSDYAVADVIETSFFYFFVIGDKEIKVKKSCNGKKFHCIIDEVI